MQIYLLYMAFAALAIAINLVVQRMVEWILLSFSWASYELLGLSVWFVLALGIGTAAGFLFKFVVDKFLVFKTKIVTLRETREEFVKYLLFAIVTTIIFWGTEISFFLLLGKEYYLIGGLVGLIIGYSLKFFLDKEYVFPATRSRAQ